MSKRIEECDINVDFMEIEPGNREDLLKKVIPYLGSADSNGENGAEYMPFGVAQYFGLENRSNEEIDAMNEAIEDKSDIYCIDRYVRERILETMKDKSDEEVIEKLMSFYDEHWGGDVINGIKYTTDANGNINFVAVAQAG